MRRLAFVLALPLAACHRTPSATERGGADAAPEDAGPAAREEPAETPATWSEARRANLTPAQIANEPGLAKNEATLRAHFGGALPGAMELQAVPLASGRQHLLLQAATPEPNPIALLVDAEGTAIWVREHPTGGILPPVRALTLTPRPDSGVALFFWDEPTGLLAARMWNADGAPFADLQVAQVAQVDAIAAAWWKSRGWLIVASSPGGARAHFLRESGTPLWASGGLPVGAPKGTRPTALALDTDASWVLVQPSARGSAERVLAYRYDSRGEALWKRAVDLGPYPGAGRVEASRARDGVVRVAWGGRSVDVRSDGTTP